jgi:hypothetical protein
VIDVWRRAWTELVPFLDMPPDIRKVVYTTNAIESINYQLRKVSKTRGQFPSDEAVYKILYLAVCDIETRDKSRGGDAKKKSILSRGSSTHGWTAALNQFAIIFPGRLPALIKPTIKIHLHNDLDTLQFGDQWQRGTAGAGVQHRLGCDLFRPHRLHGVHRR